MFRVFARGSFQQFQRWTDAVNTANSLKSQCKSLFEDIRIYDGKDLVWVYSKDYPYPQYIGPGTYKRLAMLFLHEAIAQEGEQE
jgi:hypothetical protein